MHSFDNGAAAALGRGALGTYEVHLARDQDGTEDKGDSFGSRLSGPHLL